MCPIFHSIHKNRTLITGKAHQLFNSKYMNCPKHWAYHFSSVLKNKIICFTFFVEHSLNEIKSQISVLTREHFLLIFYYFIIFNFLWEIITFIQKKWKNTRAYKKKQPMKTPQLKEWGTNWRISPILFSSWSNVKTLPYA